MHSNFKSHVLQGGEESVGGDLGQARTKKTNTLNNTLISSGRDTQSTHSFSFFP